MGKLLDKHDQNSKEGCHAWWWVLDRWSLGLGESIDSQMRQFHLITYVCLYKGMWGTGKYYESSWLSDILTAIYSPSAFFCMNFSSLHSWSHCPFLIFSYKALTWCYFSIPSWWFTHSEPCRLYHSEFQASLSLSWSSASQHVQSFFFLTCFFTIHVTWLPLIINVEMC